MARNNQDSTFVRRKFTNTESLDDVLTDLAEENYQGNVSLCLRAAIEDHRATLKGTGSEEQAIHQLARQIESFAELLQNTNSDIETIQDQLDSVTSEKGRQPVRDQSVMTEDMRSVYRTIAATDHGLRFEDIDERLDIPTRRIHSALSSLVDTAIVEPSENSPSRYYLAGQTPSGGVTNYG